MSAPENANGTLLDPADLGRVNVLCPVVNHFAELDGSAGAPTGLYDPGILLTIHEYAFRVLALDGEPIDARL